MLEDGPDLYQHCFADNEALHYLLDIYIYDIYFISFEDDYSLYYELLNTLIQKSIC